MDTHSDLYFAGLLPVAPTIAVDNAIMNPPITELYVPTSVPTNVGTNVGTPYQLRQVHFYQTPVAEGTLAQALSATSEVGIQLIPILLSIVTTLYIRVGSGPLYRVISTTYWAQTST